MFGSRFVIGSALALMAGGLASAQPLPVYPPPVPVYPPPVVIAQPPVVVYRPYVPVAPAGVYLGVGRLGIGLGVPVAPYPLVVGGGYYRGGYGYYGPYHHHHR